LSPYVKLKAVNCHYTYMYYIRYTDSDKISHVNGILVMYWQLRPRINNKQC